MRVLMAALIVSLLAAGCGGEPPSVPGALTHVVPGTPDGAPVIVVLIDTLRADHTTVYGHHRDTTPFLNQLATESVVFGRAYAPASWTRASVASLFTGRIPEAHGCEDRDGQLAPSLVTLAEVMSDAGYATRGVIANGNVVEKYGFSQGFETYRFVKDFPAHPYADATKMEAPVAEALAELDGEPRPFFLYLHYVDPHDPYVARPETDFSPDYKGPMDGTREALKPFSNKKPPPAEKQRALDLYDGEILWFDHRLRELFADFEVRGWLDTAWIAITSDHGEGLWSHRVHGHGQEVYEEQIHVPLLLRPPGGLKPHIWIEDPISLIDVAPTLVDLVGIAPPAEFDGLSWAGYLQGSDTSPTRPVVIDEVLDHFHWGAVIDGKDKLIVDFKKQKRYLFDLEANPSETESLIASSRRAQELQRIFDEEMKAAEARRPLDVHGELEEDPELTAILKAMGYLDDADPGGEDG
jgi:arylsulfatase A-like enzyme